jgi:hypothetical protein
MEPASFGFGSLLDAPQGVSSHNAGSTRLQTSPPVQQMAVIAKILPAMLHFVQ